MSELKKFYDKFGYVVLKSEIPKDQIQDYRRKILAFFHSNPHERQMTPTSILQYFEEIYDIQTNGKLLSAAREIFGPFSFVNDFQIQKNMFNISHVGGWHIDAQNQYITGELNSSNDRSHRLAKVGLCLTDEGCRFGQSIEIVPKSHKLNHNIRFILRKLLDLKYIPLLLKSILIKNLDGKINKGDYVIFDSKLLHRSATGDEKKTQKRVGFNSYEITDDSKLTIYFEVGESNSVNTLLQSALSHALDSEEGPDKEKFISDYMRIDRSLIPNEVRELIEFYGGKVSFVSEKDRLRAEEIFNS